MDVLSELNPTFKKYYWLGEANTRVEQQGNTRRCPMERKGLETSRRFSQVFCLSPATRSAGIHALFLLGTLLGLMVVTGVASANLLEVKEAVEGALCRKLATEYAKSPSSFTVHSIAKLQICLAQTLKNTASPAIPRNFDIQSPRPSTSIGDTTLPRLPTPPTPPSSIKIR